MLNCNSMDRSYLLKKSIKVAWHSRLIAKAIDLAIVVLLLIAMYPIGVIAALIYISLSDALMGGQSIGKRVIGFSVISLFDGNQCTVKQSFIRNLPILIPLASLIIPFWGWIIGFILAIPLFLIEVYLIWSLDSGLRLGDVMADTSVTLMPPTAEIKKQNVLA